MSINNRKVAIIGAGSIGIAAHHALLSAQKTVSIGWKDVGLPNSNDDFHKKMDDIMDSEVEKIKNELMYVKPDFYDDKIVKLNDGSLGPPDGRHNRRERRKAEQKLKKFKKR